MKAIFSLLMALLVTVPVALRAQAPPRIAWIGPMDQASHALYIAAFKEGLRNNGMIEGRDFTLDAQHAEGHYDRFPAMVDAALKRNPALIVVITIASVRAAQRATKTIPIVFVSTNDPLGSGLIASLAHPGGNTTGISNQAEDLIGKYVEFLRESSPKIKRIAVLQNPGNPSNPRMFDRIRASAQGHGISATAFDATSPEAIDFALERIARQQPDALIQNSDAMLFQHRARIAAFALKQRLPSISTSSEGAESGFLLAYGADRHDMYRRAATYAAKILAGAKPAELPVEQPTKFRLVINLKTAKALGIVIPQLLLWRADELIQ